MALTYTLAGLQGVLDLVDTAITSQDWDGALAQIARGNLILCGLPASAASDTQSYAMRQDLKSAADLVERAKAEAEKQANTGKRTIRAGARTLTGLNGRRLR